MAKQTLIFIHGFRGSHLGLVKIAQNLSDKYDCKVLDIPPFGETRALKSYSPDSYANFIARYIKKHNIKKPILIGHSMGSIIAAATANKYPDLIHSKLILLSPISKKPLKPIAMLSPLVTLLPNPVVSYITTRFLAVKETRQEFKDTLSLTITCAKKYTSKPDLKASAKFSAKNSVKDFKLKSKVLLVAGETDRLISKKSTKKLVNRLDNPRIVFLKNTGHLLNYEKPDETAIVIRDFLSSR